MKTLETRALWRTVLAAGLVFSVIGLTATVDADPAESEAATEESSTSAPKPRRRLPYYYAKVVTPQQRETIYQIQAQYEPQIAELRKQLKALVAKRDAEIRDVLSEEQQKHLDELIAEAKRKAAQRRKQNEES